MKKKSLLVTLVLVLAALFALAGCSSFTGIKSAYEKAGFTESEDAKTYQSEIKAALGEDYQDICTVHVFTKTGEGVLGVLEGAAAVILEFNSTKEMEEQIEKSETLKGLIKDVSTSSRVSGNCVLLVAVGADAESTFKNTK